MSAEALAEVRRWRRSADTAAHALARTRGVLANALLDSIAAGADTEAAEAAAGMTEEAAHRILGPLGRHA